MNGRSNVDATTNEAVPYWQVEVKGLAEFFPPLSNDEKDKAETQSVSNESTTTETTSMNWASSFGMAELPYGYDARVSLLTLANNIGETDVLTQAAENDPDPEVRKYARAMLESS